jgi:S1 RNA binding domain protein
MPLQVGQILNGKVTKIADFGAFVRLEDNSVGLVHISEVANTYVTSVKEHLKINDSVKVKVLSIGTDGKISLSIKQTQVKQRKSGPLELDFSRKGSDSNGDNLEDKIGKFMKESEERLQDVKKSFETKRGGKSYSKKSV